MERRSFLQQAGFGAVAVGLMGPHALSRLAGADPRLGSVSYPDPLGLLTPPSPSRPFRSVMPGAPTRMIAGYPVAEEFTGDWPGEEVNHPPLEEINAKRTPDETRDVVVVGGGISGLSAAYLLREHDPVVLEFFPNFGGNARGEVFSGTPYSLGGAYIITPDKGTFLDDLYTQLGLPDVVRVDNGPNGDPGESPVELGGTIYESGFWDGAYANDPDVALAFEKYRQVVLNYTGNYPEIPLPKFGADFVRDLDTITLKQSIEDGMGVPVPPALAAAIQAYCYSSFSAGWEEISAASGWNFLAAEEFGRWVFPGSNTYIAHAMWEALRAREIQKNAPGSLLRAGCKVYDVRLESKRGSEAGGLVTYADPSGTLRTIRAKRVVMACQKFVAKYILKDVGALDAPKLDAMHTLQYRAYLVANVALRRQPKRDFYDIFQIANGHDFPTSDAEAEVFNIPTDVLAGHFAVRGDRRGGVLTFYWPLPWGDSRFRIVEPGVSDVQVDFGTRLAPHLTATLGRLGLTPSDVQQVRLTRWGHAMPLSSPRFISDGHAEHLVRPFEGAVHFVSQDNWALPAVENCLLDAEVVAAQIESDLSA